MTAGWSCRNDGWMDKDHVLSILSHVGCLVRMNSDEQIFPLDFFLFYSPSDIKELKKE